MRVSARVTKRASQAQSESISLTQPLVEQNTNNPSVVKRLSTPNKKSKQTKITVSDVDGNDVKVNKSY
jgi:hypothetical protein